MSELIRKSELLEKLNDLYELNWTDDYYLTGFNLGLGVAIEAVEELQPINAVELPCKVGDKVYIIERDENGRAFEVTAYMFLAKANEAVICTIFVNNSEDVNDILQYHIKRTAENWDTYLSVFPVGDCFRNREEAEKALEDLKNV